MSLLWTKEKRTVAAVIPIDGEAQPWSDETLMASLKERDQEALAELFHRYSRLVFTIGIRILQDAGEAEEIVQDVFLYLYQKAEQFDEAKGTPKAWIVQITHSRSIDRKNFLYRRHFYVGTDVSVLADTLAGPNNLERDLVSKWNLAQLEDALQDLSEKQRRTLEMFFFEGLELKEIAIRLDESAENVRHYYYRGLQKMRKNVLVQKLKDKEKE
ncbi:MAG: sigma-70 family RNA polymerase sigma factor [Edaphobacter sp.]